MRGLNARIPYNWEFAVPVNFACHSVVFGVTVSNFQCCHNNIPFKEYQYQLYFTKKNALTFH
jgi:hypothetical protein